jgi:hypothetical protein
MLRHLLFVAVALCTVNVAVAKESIRCNGARRLVHLRIGHIDPCSTAAARCIDAGHHHGGKACCRSTHRRRQRHLRSCLRRLHRRLTQVSEQASGTDSAADVQQVQLMQKRQDCRSSPSFTVIQSFRMLAIHPSVCASQHCRSPVQHRLPHACLAVHHRFRPALLTSIERSV